MHIFWETKLFSELSSTELYAIFKLRLQVFVVEQNCVYQDADDKDQVSYHLTGKDESNNLVAYARIIPAGISYDECSIGRVINAENYRGKGLGKELMKQSMSFIHSQYGPVDIRISAQSYLARFYSDFGFRIQGPEYMEDHLPHIEMLYSVSW